MLLAFTGSRLIRATAIRSSPTDFAIWLVFIAPWLARVITVLNCSRLMGNHDRPRLATRIGPDQARVAAMLLMTLRGTPTLYYGEEIGMKQAAILPEQIRDPFERNVPGIGIGRDGCRTPMQWDGTKWAGFSDVDPWLPIAANFRDENVNSYRKDKGSLYWLYRRLIDFRRNHVALAEGSYKPLMASGELLLFCRELRAERVLIALNMGSEPIAVSFPDKRSSGRVLLSSFADREGEEVRASFDLRRIAPESGCRTRSPIRNIKHIDN
ncbi:alpha-amylase family glycosyl hydrolase [Bradyrhizobium sp. CCBAU 051011]|uniref:alpha-amylase family glycosyl hydrolase n=1 Tax=Bradyrhizobium sp. CCBAU 051011 TaxID=858422 RepID=UPI0013795659|nr:alpha-amylase family glycosyl hydrolase [Bradyrhizobium sp. CCBAU 051011]